MAYGGHRDDGMINLDEGKLENYGNFRHEVLSNQLKNSAAKYNIHICKTTQNDLID